MNDPIDTDGRDPHDDVPGWRALGDELAGTPGVDEVIRARMVARAMAAALDHPDESPEASPHESADDGGPVPVPIASRRRPAWIGAAAAMLLALAVPVGMWMTDQDDDTARPDLGVEPPASTAGVGEPPNPGIAPETTPVPDPSPTADGRPDRLPGAFADRAQLEGVVAGLPDDPVATGADSPCPPAAVAGDVSVTLQRLADLDGRSVLVERLASTTGTVVVIRSVPGCEQVP